MISFSKNKQKSKKVSPIRQDDYVPSNTRFATALANLILAISSGWALRKLSSFKTLFHFPGEEVIWTKIPFYLVLLHAVVCFVTFGNPEYGKKIRWLHTWTFILCVVVGLPCFTLQLAFQHNVPLQFLLPIAGVVGITGLIYQVVRGELKSLNGSVMNCLVIVCLTSISLISYIHCNYYGLSAVIAYGINYFVIGVTGTAFNLPAIDLFSYGYVFFNYFAVKAIFD